MKISIQSLCESIFYQRSDSLRRHLRRSCVSRWARPVTWTSVDELSRWKTRVKRSPRWRWLITFSVDKVLLNDISPHMVTFSAHFHLLFLRFARTSGGFPIAHRVLVCRTLFHPERRTRTWVESWKTLHRQNQSINHSINQSVDS